MTKIELVAAIAKKTEFSKKDSEKALIAVIESITDALKKGEKVSLVGFGTFEVRTRAAREGINPQSQKKIKIPAKKVPAFKAGKGLKETIAASKAKKK
jgi:DNA-binding protein HU-beta